MAESREPITDGKRFPFPRRRLNASTPQRLNATAVSCLQSQMVFRAPGARSAGAARPAGAPGGRLMSLLSAARRAGARLFWVKQNPPRDASVLSPPENLGNMFSTAN
ncbi:hypothetical protein EYF80_042456 [Liparis tanakae]|uniref:Uncharacterized protein n=1 Tax=Liparis tanakae TaxID=230148 RepID=A0A4Z2G1D8_9TELE|nr:hypothetical protein EYF80_042456 [Liparis tanakae]